MCAWSAEEGKLGGRRSGTGEDLSTLDVGIEEGGFREKKKEGGYSGSGFQNDNFERRRATHQKATVEMAIVLVTAMP